MPDQYKALTYIHFPFTDRSFSPGDTIDRSEFEEYEEAASAAVPVHDDDRGGHVPTADEMIEHFIEFGSLSDDMDAPLHPDHIPADPTKPTIATLIEQAKAMLEQLEETGQEVPDGLRALAETDYQHVVAGDAGSGVDSAG